MSLPPIMLQPRDPDTDPPDVLQDVMVFGQLGDEPPEWHIGFRHTRFAVHDGSSLWYLTDTSEPPLKLKRVFAWASMPPDPRQPPSLRAAA